MGHQRRKRVPVLEPVLENYMGPPIDSAPEPVAPHRHNSALNPVQVILGKLRDKYVKAMTEMSLMRGDLLASAAGYQGCAAPEKHHAATRREKEHVRALREELAASNSVAVDAEDSSDDEDRVVGACYRHQ